MNESDPHVPEERDVEELLKPLQEIESPDESNMLNRKAVADEIAKAKAAPPTLAPDLDPIWRRTVGVPIPILVAAASLLVFLSIAHLRQELMTEPNPSQRIQQGDGNSSKSEESTDLAKTRRTGESTHVYYQSEVYVCGVGRLRTEMGYFEKDAE